MFSWIFKVVTQITAVSAIRETQVLFDKIRSTEPVGREKNVSRDDDCADAPGAYLCWYCRGAYGGRCGERARPERHDHGGRKLGLRLRRRQNASGSASGHSSQRSSR